MLTGLLAVGCSSSRDVPCSESRPFSAQAAALPITGGTPRPDPCDPPDQSVDDTSGWLADDRGSFQKPRTVFGVRFSIDRGTYTGCGPPQYELHVRGGGVG